MRAVSVTGFTSSTCEDLNDEIVTGSELVVQAKLSFLLSIRVEEYYQFWSSLEISQNCSVFVMHRYFVTNLQINSHDLWSAVFTAQFSGSRLFPSGINCNNAGCLAGAETSTWWSKGAESICWGWLFWTLVAIVVIDKNISVDINDAECRNTLFWSSSQSEILSQGNILHKQSSRRTLTQNFFWRSLDTFDKEEIMHSSTVYFLSLAIFLRSSIAKPLPSPQYPIIDQCVDAKDFPYEYSVTEQEVIAGDPQQLSDCTGRKLLPYFTSDNLLLH